MERKTGQTKEMLTNAIVAAYRGSLRVYVVMASVRQVHYALNLSETICNEQHIRYVKFRGMLLIRVTNGLIVFTTIDDHNFSYEGWRIRGEPESTPIYLDHHADHVLYQKMRGPIDIPRNDQSPDQEKSERQGKMGDQISYSGKRVDWE